MPKRIFISFAIEDEWARDYLVGQKWKTQCRERVRGCDGVIALLSKKTRNADGARWEMQCAVEEGVPIIGVHIHADDKGAIPPELAGKRVIEWTWPGIDRFLNSL